MPQSSNRVGNAPRFVFQILNLKSQIEQARPAGHVVKSLAVEDKSGERSGVSPPVPRFCTGTLTHAARQLSRT